MNKEIKIGVLLPQSKQYNTLDRDFINGIRLNNLNAKLHIENIGIGNDTKLIIEKIQKLSLQEEIKLFIGFFGHHNIQQVYKYASDNNIILIAADMGANIPLGSEKHEGVFLNSFGLIESAYFLGRYFSKNNYKKIGSSTCFYDAGYGFLEAMESSFTDDIAFTGHYVTPLHPRENEAEIMAHTISGYDADAVFGVYSGVYAHENAAFMAKNKIGKKHPFFMMPFSVNNIMIEDVKNTTYEIHITTSWVENETEDCKKFTSEYKKTYGSVPTTFSLLGYENGLVIKSILESEDNYSSYKESIEQLILNGPRGTIQFDKETNRSYYDHHIYKMNLDADNNIIPGIIETFKNNGEYIKAAIAHERPAIHNGWDNAYLCH